MRTRTRTTRRTTLRTMRLSYMRRKMTSCLRSQGRVKNRRMTKRKKTKMRKMMPQLKLRLGKGTTDPGE
jgi:hypothetical protein